MVVDKDKKEAKDLAMVEAMRLLKERVRKVGTQFTLG
jgi:hypothetical protein